MKLIVGLGNPGHEYERTKHNVGFWVIDLLLSQLNLALDKSKFNGIYVKSDKFIIAKPLTYMNLSGHFVRQIADFYQVKIDDIVIIHDDYNVEIGKVKLKKDSSSGGQNGMADIIKQMNSQKIARIKIGIGSLERSNIESRNFVLSPFKSEDLGKVKLSIEKAVVLAERFIDEEFDIIMGQQSL